ncbi:hypothetical protein SAMN05444411_102421 [Lutibacter oricola]|uniref:DUF6265 domain-containing protein n=1 Tax=Lutibacter oricola TaxID=762486 RepID=A0A1H2XBB5_9FLAO|nr:DUF6265 family protein [Lutibacter oricola]SDW90056.1 hypothetical protein SAMN05444411_102421 [Lutibacter oricola]
MKFYLAFLCLICTLSITSQNTLKLNNSKSPKATLTDVSWISGYWTGEALGGFVEEIWSDPYGKSMMGSFKLVTEGGEISFYELCAISEENNTLILRIKHFSKDLKGWEEKNETTDFKLVKIEKHKAYFDGLTFDLIDENNLDMYVVFKENGKEEQEMKFSYVLKK